MNLFKNVCVISTLCAFVRLVYQMMMVHWMIMHVQRKQRKMIAIRSIRKGVDSAFWDFY